MGQGRGFGTVRDPPQIWPWLIGGSAVLLALVGGSLALAYNSGLPPTTFAVQKSKIQVGLHYKPYRQRWQQAIPLEQLIVLLLPLQQPQTGEQIETILTKQQVPVKREQVEAALALAVQDQLLLAAARGYTLSQPALARALQHQEGPAGLQKLAEQVRHDHPLAASAKRFFSQAGFELTPVAEPLLFHGSPSTPSLKRLLPAMVYVRFLPGQPLDSGNLLTVQKQVQQVGPEANIALIVTDQRPTDDGWAQIGTLRLNQQNPFTILPLESALINEGLAAAKATRVLYDEVEKRLGAAYDPYDVRDPVAGAFSFFGRDALLESLLRRLGEGRPLGIFGLRKLGKSSLLQALRDQAPFPVAAVNLQTVGRGNLTELYQRILEYWAQWSRVRYNMAWSAPQLGGEDATGAFVNATLKLLNQLESHSEGARLGLFLDEVEEIVPQKDGSGADLQRYLTLLGALRGLVDEDGRLSLAVASLNPRINQINAWPTAQNPIFNLLQEVKLAPLATEDCIRMVRNIGLQVDLVYSQPSLAAIADLSGGHPFLARQLCSLLYQQRGQQGGEVDLAAVWAGVRHFIFDPATIPHLDAGIWQEAGNAALWGATEAQLNQDILLELAQADTPLSSAALLGSQANIRRTALITLENFHLIHQIEADRYTLRFGLLKAWLRHHKLGLEPNYGQQ